MWNLKKKTKTKLEKKKNRNEQNPHEDKLLGKFCMFKFDLVIFLLHIRIYLFI